MIFVKSGLQDLASLVQCRLVRTVTVQSCRRLETSQRNPLLPSVISSMAQCLLMWRPFLYDVGYQLQDSRVSTKDKHLLVCH
jgi:hypothetical protein